MSNIKIWLGDLRKYNEGQLVGEWVELPIQPDELQELLRKYSNEGKGDYFIADFERPEGLENLKIGKHSCPTHLNEVAEELDRLDSNERGRLNYLLGQGHSFVDALSEIEDVTYYEEMTLVDVAEQLLDDGLFGGIPDALRPYIDVSLLARDLRIGDGYEEVPGVGVFHYIG